MIDIPDTVVADILAKLTVIDNILAPYKVVISPSQKKHMSKIADATIAFADKTNGYMDTAPAFNPPFVVVSETHTEYANFKKVSPVVEKLKGMYTDVTNISIVSGSDAYTQFLAYYNSVKKATDLGIPGAKTIYDDLAKRFPGRPTTPPVPPVTP